MKTMKVLAGLLAMSFLTAPAFATPVAKEKSNIKADLARRFSDGGPTNVSWHTSGQIQYKGKTVQFGKKIIGFTGSSFQGPGGGNITFKGFADTSGSRAKITITEQQGP